MVTTQVLNIDLAKINNSKKDQNNNGGQENSIKYQYKSDKLKNRMI